MSERTVTALRRRLGSTGLDVHPLCLGGNVFGWTADRDATFALLDAYVDAGGNFVDTADVYSAWVPGNVGGESERLIGAWLARRGSSHDVLVATKVGFGAEDIAPGLGRANIVAACEASLERLGVEAIDLYYVHKDLDEYPLDETLQALDELVRAGKVRAIAASNYSAPRLREALELSDTVGLESYGALQPKFNLVDRDEFGDDLREVCEQYDVGVAVYSSLASGFLTGKYRPNDPPPSSPRAEGVVSAYLSDGRALGLLETAERVAERYAATVAQVALAWALAQRGVTSVIASATSPAQLAELLGAATLELDEDDLAALA